MRFATHPSLWDGLGFRRCTPATWKRWADVEACELWQAVALMIGVDPDEVPYRKLNDLSPFVARMQMAADLHPPSGLRRNEQKPWRSVVRIDEFRTWATLLLLPLPDAFPRGVRPEVLPSHLSAAALEALADLSWPDAQPRATASSPVKNPPRKARASSKVSAEYLREPDLCAEIAVSRATMWRWVKSGRLPKPIKLSPGVTVWRRAEVEAWIASNADGSRRKRSK